MVHKLQPEHSICCRCQTQIEGLKSKGCSPSHAALIRCAHTQHWPCTAPLHVISRLAVYVGSWHRYMCPGLPQPTDRPLSMDVHSCTWAHKCCAPGDCSTSPCHVASPPAIWVLTHHALGVLRVRQHPKQRPNLGHPSDAVHVPGAEDTLEEWYIDHQHHDGHAD